MSRFELSKVLHKSIKNERFTANLEADPAATISEFDLSEKEKEAIIKGDEALIRDLMAEDQPARRQHTNNNHEALSSGSAHSAGD